MKSENGVFVVKNVRFDSIKLIDENGQFHNGYKTYDAIGRARNLGLDLVCFNPPNGKDLALCKLLDFNKWKYQEEKKQKGLEKQNRHEIKEIQFTPNIAENDIAHKMRQVNDFLADGDSVVISMKLRGRERNFMGDAEAKFNNIISMCVGGKEIGRKKGGDFITAKIVKI